MQELKDTQNERDTRQISIDRVGVRGVRYPIVVSDKEQRTQSTVATLALMVDLPEQYKGTHMSRFVEALHEHRRYLDVHSAVRLPARLLRKLPAQRARGAPEPRAAAQRLPGARAGPGPPLPEPHRPRAPQRPKPARAPAPPGALTPTNPADCSALWALLGRNTVYCTSVNIVLEKNKKLSGGRSKANSSSEGPPLWQ